MSAILLVVGCGVFLGIILIIACPPPGWTLNIKLVCPHCQTAGFCSTIPITVKQGISGGKATAALLTGGLSVLATGLSRAPATMTKVICSNCKSTWQF